MELHLEQLLVLSASLLVPAVRFCDIDAERTEFGPLVGFLLGIALVVLAFHLFRRDLANRQRADDAARRLAAIVESSDDAIIFKTLDGTIAS